MAAITKKDFWAQVIIEAAFTTDALVCQKYAISERGLRKWRKTFADGSDAEFTALCRTKKAVFDARWAENCSPALTAGINFLADAARSAGEPQKKNPAFIAAIAGAVKIVADVKLTSSVIDARIANTNRPTDDVPEQIFGQTVASELKQ
ncbi:MAG TPA: hypothetical protein VEF04_20025 [Blastocatellia bacterium]|nr:hypothetical protein [Blastocatellia bacterium]